MFLLGALWGGKLLLAEAFRVCAKLFSVGMSLLLLLKR